MRFIFLTTMCLVCLFACHGPRNHPPSILLPAASIQTPLTSTNDLIRVLEYRWSLSRMEEFTKYSPTVETRARQGVKLDDDDWTGELYKGQTMFSHIHFLADVTDGTPTHFAIFAGKGKKTWVIEAGEIAELFQPRIVKLYAEN